MRWAEHFTGHSELVPPIGASLYVVQRKPDTEAKGTGSPVSNPSRGLLAYTLRDMIAERLLDRVGHFSKASCFAQGSDS